MSYDAKRYLYVPVRVALSDPEREVRVGDTVYVRALVIEVQPGLGLVVQLFSKTDKYDVFVRSDHVVEMDVPNPPTEPGNGSWVTGTVGGQPTVFRRDDSACADPTNATRRRFPCRWRDYATGDWVDWPTAYQRGADPARQLHEDISNQNQE